MQLPLSLVIAALLANAPVLPATPVTPASPTEPSGDPHLDERVSQRPPTDDESLALAALEGLMAQPPERALPLLKKVLSGSQSILVKRRALFVLSQLGVADAQTLLVETARSGDAALRGEAIRNIGISGDPQSLPALQQLYDAGDAKTKSQVLQAWLLSGSRKEVYQAALNARTDEDADAAIRTLSVMGARDELRKLGEGRKANRHLVRAYAIAGDLVSLRKVAQSDGESSMRVDAVRSIGIIHSEDARVALREIYSSAKEPEIRDAALRGMLLENDEKGVLSLYQASKNADEKRALLRTLSMMHGDAALQAINAALEDKK